MATQDVEYRKNSPAMARSLERVVRHRAYRADERGRTAHRRGNDGRCRRERVNGGTDSAGRRGSPTSGERVPTCGERPPTSWEDTPTCGGTRANPVERRANLAGRRENLVGKRANLVGRGKNLLPGRRLRCLTNPSSATEAGKEGRNHEREPAASLCSLERVVRPAPTERTERGPTCTPAGERRALPPERRERRNWLARRMNVLAEEREHARPRIT